MKIYIIFIALIISTQGHAQSWLPTVPAVKEVIQQQDSTLENIYQLYLKKVDSLSQVNNVQTCLHQIDSTAKYISLAQKYLDSGDLRSCIDMIHFADKYLVDNQKRLHLPWKD